MKPYGPINENALDLRVADLLTDDLKWNKKRIEEVLPELSEQIQSLKPSMSGAEDIYIWHPLPSGVYSTKSGYNAVANTPRYDPATINQGAFSWIKDVWSIKCSPKLRVFLWSIIRRAIPLGENLQRRGMMANVNCLRCGEKETAMHAFFLCPFAKAVWQQVPLLREIDIAVTDDFESAVVKFCRAICLPPSGISTPILSWICWAIWIARNRLIFEDKRSNPSDVVLKGLTLAQEWIQAQSFNQKGLKGLLQEVRGQQDEEGSPTPTCYTDASWDATTKKSGSAWIISYSPEASLREGSAIVDNVSSPLMVEALALRSGLIAAAELNITELRVCSDCQKLIRAIKNKHQIKEIFSIVTDIMQIASVFISISFVFVPRSENRRADSLAKRALSISHVL